MKVTVKTQGLNEILKELNDVTEERISKINGCAKNAAIYCMGEAKRNISQPYPKGAIDTGQLRNSITMEENVSGNETVYRVGTNVTYAPYIEFGTRPHFPPIQALMEWVKRHTRAAKGKTPLFERNERGIAYAIALKISKRGTPPKPYLRPAFISAKNKLLQDLEKL